MLAADLIRVQVSLPIADRSTAIPSHLLSAPEQTLASLVTESAWEDWA
jgi:hypothetical protein